MGARKINKILIAVSIVLGITFVGCFVHSVRTPFFSFIDTLSAISSFFVAVLTIIYVYTTSKQMDFMKQQLEQMQKDQRMSEQPILDLAELKFEIERPRFYYTPPEDEYSFLSRHHFFMQIHNVSNYPALFVDISAELLVEENEKQLCLGATSRRLNLIAANAVSDSVGIMFTGDESNRIMSALRSYSTSGLPKVQLTICYKSLSGASYLLKHTYWLDVSEDSEQDIKILKNWHSIMTSAPIEEKETLDLLKKVRGQKKWDTLFEATKERFDKKLMGESALAICLAEIPQKFSLKAISDEEFEKEIELHQYGRYVGHHVGVGACKEDLSQK